MDPPSMSNGAAQAGEAEIARSARLANGEVASAPPEKVAELSEACRRFVKAKYGIDLDHTPETLSLLDQYVRDARPEIAERPEGLSLLEAAVGAYFGEVIRKAYAARWFCEGAHDGWRLEFVHVFLTFNPIGVAREALLLGEAEGWHAHLEVEEAEREYVSARLASLPEVGDEDYYAPSTRFDVLEITVHALRAEAEARGLGDVTFGPEDYGRPPAVGRGRP